MRKRIKKNCVCSGKPNGHVMDMSSKELNEQVEWGMKAIECTRNTKAKAKRGLQLGMLCEDAGHPVLALQVWIRTYAMVRIDNYDWVDEYINHKVYSFDSKIVSVEQEELGRNIDRLWRKLGHDEQAHFLAEVERDYRDIWLWKYQEPYWDR